MAGEHTATPTPKSLVEAFPLPGPRVRRAFHQLWIAEAGTDEQKAKLGPLAELPRPWDPPTCLDRGLRWELWMWLDNVVAWLNAEYVWDIGNDALIPECWPLHPHLVHEVATLADQRRRAGIVLNSGPLDDWHRIHLPSFIDRMRGRLKGTCNRTHGNWPGRPAQARYDTTFRTREVAYRDDLMSLPDIVPQPANNQDAKTGTPRHDSLQAEQAVLPLRHLQLLDGTQVNTTTGEVVNEDDRYYT